MARERKERSLAEVHGLVGTAARRSLCCCLLLAVIDHGGVSASATTFATASLTGCSSHPGGDCDTPINKQWKELESDIDRSARKNDDDDPHAISSSSTMPGEITLFN
jgi:hypothetical protein